MERQSQNLYSISYNPLWKLLIDKGISKPKLRDMTGIVPSTMTKMQKNEYVSMDVLVRICSALRCGISDVIEVHEGKASTEDIVNV